MTNEQINDLQCQVIADGTLINQLRERVRELEAEVDGLESTLAKTSTRCGENHAEAERLRKAINEALMMLRQLDDPEQEVVFMDIHAPTEILEAALTPPTAASGEAFQIDPAWLIKMADAEDAVGGLAIGVSPFVSQPPSAPAAESNETGWYCTKCHTKLESYESVCPTCASIP